MLQFLLILIVGGFAGIMTGMMGASGVMAVVPGMLLLGYTAHQAIGTSLAVDMTASLIVAGTYFQHRRVELRQALWIALASVLGAQLGSRFSIYVPEIGISSGFGVLLIISAALLWRNGASRNLSRLASSTVAQKVRQRPLLVSTGIGLWAGFYCGMFGSGGGMLFLLALLLLGYSLHSAVGTSTLIMALTTASGTVGHALLGNLPVLTVMGITGGTVVGSLASARLANRLDERHLERAIAAVLALLGLMVTLLPLMRMI